MFLIKQVLAINLSLLVFSGLGLVAKAASKIECFDGLERIQASIACSNVRYPESPVWVDGGLFLVEYARDRVTRVKDGKAQTFWTKKGCGPAAVTRYRQDEFLIACYNDDSVVHLSSQGLILKSFREAGAGSPGSKAFKGPNDFAADLSGGIYFTASGVFELAAPIEGEVYYLGSDQSLRRVAGGIHYSNGIAVVPDGRSLLVAEHLKNRILKYQILKPGVLGEKPEVFIDLNGRAVPPQKDLAKGLQGPDGMRIGPDGVLYIAQYGGARVLKVSPGGEFIGSIQFESDYSNTDNVWVDEKGGLFVSAFMDSKDLGFPGAIFKILDPLLTTRKSLTCRVSP